MTSKIYNAPLSDEEANRFGAELDALRDKTCAQIGARDARYIRNIVKAVRYTGAAGRALLFIGIFPPAWILGTLLLGLSKILNNMELGHNVIHGQYDWMNDPDLKGKTFEWDIAGTSEAWRRTHNFKHHTYTNIRGMDDDIGYGLLRIFPEQRWKPVYLLQPFYAILFCLLFEWGIAIQDLRLGRFLNGKLKMAQFREEFRPVGKKIRTQVLRDYVFFPLLAGPFYLPVLTGNLVANVIRNVWTFCIIFCGHFTENVQTFSRHVLNNETRGRWYLRQLAGSSNLTGSKLFHIMTGNLSHQIEHHLYPEIPAWRYAEMSIEVQRICQRYGQFYNTGKLHVQFGQVVHRIIRHAFPSKPGKSTGTLATSGA